MEGAEALGVPQIISVIKGKVPVLGNLKNKISFKNPYQVILFIVTLCIIDARVEWKGQRIRND